MYADTKWHHMDIWQFTILCTNNIKKW
uniref:Uncharacterized protein n=1 Tax=Megaselia scalaris TaxID=36166 RepID=T1GV56_MEGSC